MKVNFRGTQSKLAEKFEVFLENIRQDLTLRRLQTSHSPYFSLGTLFRHIVVNE